MYRVLKALILGFTACLMSQTSEAKEWGVGLFSSPHAVGVQFQALGESEIDIIGIMADLYGVIKGQTKDIGFKLGYTRDYILNEVHFQNCGMIFHLGAGAMLGYVHDKESGIFVNSNETLENNMGLMAALSCSIGLRFDFIRPVAIDLSFAANPGIHLRRSSETGSLYLTVYKNGISQIIMPRLSVIYNF